MSEVKIEARYVEDKPTSCKYPFADPVGIICNDDGKCSEQLMEYGHNPYGIAPMREKWLISYLIPDFVFTI